MAATTVLSHEVSLMVAPRCIVKSKPNLDVSNMQVEPKIPECYKTQILQALLISNHVWMPATLSWNPIRDNAPTIEQHIQKSSLKNLRLARWNICLSVLA